MNNTLEDLPDDARKILFWTGCWIYDLVTVNSSTRMGWASGQAVSA